MIALCSLTGRALCTMAEVPAVFIVRAASGMVSSVSAGCTEIVMT